MTFILLAISLLIVFCVIAYYLAIYALPFMVGLTAFQYVYATDAGFPLSLLAALGVAFASVALVILALGFAKNPALRLIALALFAVPAAIAGYALVHGSHEARDRFCNRDQHALWRGRLIHRHCRHAQSQRARYGRAPALMRRAMAAPMDIPKAFVAGPCPSDQNGMSESYCAGCHRSQDASRTSARSTSSKDLRARRPRGAPLTAPFRYACQGGFGHRHRTSCKTGSRLCKEGSGVASLNL